MGYLFVYGPKFMNRIISAALCLLFRAIYMKKTKNLPVPILTLAAVEALARRGFTAFHQILIDKITSK